MDWTIESAFDFLKSNPSFDDFVTNGRLCLAYEYKRVKFLIFQENFRASFYFALPKTEGADYEGVFNLIDVCGHELNRLLEAEQDKRTGIM